MDLVQSHFFSQFVGAFGTLLYTQNAVVTNKHNR